MKREFRKAKEHRGMGWLMLAFSVFLLGGVVWGAISGESGFWFLALLPLAALFLYGFVDESLERIELRQTGIRRVSPFYSHDLRVSEVKAKAILGPVGSKFLFWRKDRPVFVVYPGHYEDPEELVESLREVFGKAPDKPGSEVVEGQREKLFGGGGLALIGLSFCLIALLQMTGYIGAFAFLFGIGLASILGGVWVAIRPEATFLLDRGSLIKRLGSRKTRYSFAQLISVKYGATRRFERLCEVMYLEFENGKVEVWDWLTNYMAIRERVMEVSPPPQAEGDRLRGNATKWASVIGAGLIGSLTVGLHLMMAVPKLKAGIEPQQTVGRVVDIKEGNSKIVFTVNGEEVHIKDMLGQDGEFGKEVVVTYSSRNPRNAVADGSILVRYAAGNAGVTLVAIGLLVWVMARSQRKRENGR